MKIIERLLASPAPSDRIDLSEDLGLTLALIERPWRWRQRLVETLSLQSATEVRATSAYQIEFPPEMLDEVGAADALSANVILPVTTRPKRPLLGFDISTSHGAPAHLLPRRSIASIQADYVRSLADLSNVAPALEGLSDRLIEAVSVFTPALYEQKLKELGRLEAVRWHLLSGIGLRATATDVERWLATADAARDLLVAALEEPPDELSSSENILLAVPHLAPIPESVGEVDEVVGQYERAITAAAEACDDDLLAAIAEYGRRWEMLVEVEVPLRRPTEIVVAEDRPLTIARHGWVWQRVAMGDATSVHIQVRALDPVVEIDRYNVLDLNGHEVGLGPWEAVRHTRDTVALYSSVDERPFFADVGVRLRPTSYVRWTAIGAAVVTLSAAAGVALLDSKTDFSSRLTLLTLPTSLAATLILVREQSGLATRLTSGTRLTLAISLALLWVTLLGRLLLFYPSPVRDAPTIKTGDESSLSSGSPASLRGHPSAGARVPLQTSETTYTL